jgi:hypothetical protein
MPSLTDSPEDANRMRWDRGPGHYEVWYATLSDPASRQGFWIRYTLEAPYPGHGEPYCQLWFARFDPERPERTFAFNRRFPIDRLAHQASPFSLSIGEATLRHDGMKGSLAGGGHEVEWELAWQPAGRLHLHLPSPAYEGSWADTQVLSPNLNVAARGHLTVDGERLALEGAPLGQTHLWGRKHAYAWAWSHCNAFQGDRGAALETLTIRLRLGPIVLPKLTLLSLYLEGEEPDLIEFRQLWQLPMARSEYGTGRYFVTAANAEWKIEAEYLCRPEDMILTEYVDPDGDPAYCHNTECADLRVRVLRRSPFVGRFREHRTLFAHRSGHYEWGARAGDPLVKKRHVTLSG